MAYQLTADPDTVLRLSDGAFIPRDTGNPDYLSFLEWEAAGNTTEPMPTVDVPSPESTPIEARLARIGITVDELRALLSAPPA